MTISLTIPDVVKDRVIDAISINHNYQAGAETKAQFVKRMIISWIKNQVIIYEAIQAGDDARELATTNIETDIIIT